MENNSDHWNALLISLRELAEWVIAEEAVLEAMGPIAGDEISIRRQQEAARSFSRQLEDKRAVIENNLQTGRQHLDSANIQAEEGKVNSVQEARVKCFAVHILKFEILQTTPKNKTKCIKMLDLLMKN